MLVLAFILVKSSFSSMMHLDATIDLEMDAAGVPTLPVNDVKSAEKDFVLQFIEFWSPFLEKFGVVRVWLPKSK